MALQGAASSFDTRGIFVQVDLRSEVCLPTTQVGNVTVHVHQKWP